jgi:thioredoxin
MTMIRKYILVLLLGSFTMAGCGNAENNSTKANTPAPENVVEVNEKVKDTSTKAGTIKLTKADFLSKIMDYESNPTEWIYKGDRPALIDFYADWCGPCRIAAPILEELAAEYKDEIYIYKIDTEVERELAQVFGISSIPAFLFIPQEGRPTMSNGIARTPEETKEMFSRMIDELLLGGGNPEAL